MAQQLFFSRDTKVYIAKGDFVWDLPVLDGFSFSQATNSSEITLAEMEASGGASRRGRKQFNDSLAPAEWSFSTYVRPFKSAGSGTGAADTVAAKVHAVEEILWALFSGPAAYSSSTFTDQFTADTTTGQEFTTIDFSESNKATLGTCDIFFVVGGANRKIYKLKDAVVNEASLDFDIDGIATINWSGFGKIITEEAAFDGSGAIARNIDSTSNFIRNRLTSLEVENNADGGVTYGLTLTGGNITFTNNITFLTPETLCTINQPLGHVTGTRSISGSFTCYLNTANDSSAELFENLIEDQATVTNSHTLTFNIGGGNSPNLVVAMPTAHLEVPTHSIEDIISLETNFHALPSTIGGTDEATIAYTGS
jgi:hypothetical protein